MDNALDVAPTDRTASHRRSTTCVAARLDAGDAGEVVVYGTVLPWNGDVGPDKGSPAKGWEEFPRAGTGQGREWASLRERSPEATLIVEAGKAWHRADVWW